MRTINAVIIISVCVAAAPPKAPPVMPGIDDAYKESIAARLGTIPEARKASSHTRECVVITATWCPACQSIKAIASNVPGVRVLDYDRDRAEVERLYRGSVPSLPRYVTVVDGVGVKNWFGPTTADGLGVMRDWEP